jgi:hypothetical protein
MASDYLIKNLKAPAKRKYSDGRPAATLRMDAKDNGADWKGVYRGVT